MSVLHQTHQRYHAQYCAPAPALGARVDSYCVLKPTKKSIGAVPWHIMPDGAAHILFHLTKIDDLSDGYKARLSFVGPRTIYTIIDRKERALTFIVRLKSAISFAKFSCSLSEMADRSIPLGNLFAQDLDGVKAKLTALALADDIPGMAKEVDQLLTHHLHEVYADNSLGQQAVKAILLKKGHICMKQLATDLGVSDRHLRAVFKKETGLGPKRYARINRVTETIRLADGGYNLGWSQLALTAGYYDQSHMIDEFQALLGESTEAFIARENREDVLMTSSVFSNTGKHEWVIL